MTTPEMLDAANILHPATHADEFAAQGSTIVSSGKGIYLRDNHGHELIDAVAGLWCVNVGYGRQELADAMQAAASNLSYFHTFTGMSNMPQIELAQRLMEKAPGSLSKVFFGSSGSDGNDSLIKIVRYVNNLRGRPQKKKIISRWQAYHGTSLGSASLTGLPSFHKDFDLPLEGILHTGSPDYFRHGEAGESEQAFALRRAAELEALILEQGPDTVAAFIAEPVLGAGGVVTPPEGYFGAVQAVLRKYDILFIVDEVVCAYGRLGTWFGCERYDLQPDMMTTAKALTSGYFPMSATFVSEGIWDTLREGSRKHGNFAHGYTYAGHPIGAAVANANLDIIENDKLVENAAHVGAYFQEQLRTRFADHPQVGQIRGTGMIAAVQMMQDGDSRRFFKPEQKIAKAVAAQCYSNGLIVRPLPTLDSAAFSPPLICTNTDIDAIIDRFADALDTVVSSL